MPRVPGSLTAKQKEAVRLYTTPGIYIDNDKSRQTYKNQTLSAIGAGYVAQWANNNIKQIFTPKTLAVISKKELIVAKKADITVAELVEGFKTMAFPGEGVATVNNGDKLRAMELLGKYKAMFKEVAININADIPSDPALRLQWCKEEIARIETHKGIIADYDSTKTAIATRF